MTRLHRLSPLWLGVLAALLYAPTLQYSFVNYDDPWLLQENATLHHLHIRNLQAVWLDISPSQRIRLGREYLPVRDTSAMLDFALYGHNAKGHHLTNVLLYGLLCGLLVLLLAWWLQDRQLAIAAGLLYACHPYHVEAVAWLSERKGLLAACWIILAMLALYRFAKTLRWHWVMLAALSMVLGIWSKAIATMGVPFLAALLWFYPPDPDHPPSTTAQTKPAFIWQHWLGWLVVAVAGVAAFAPVWWVGQQAEMLVKGQRSDLWQMAHIHGLYLKQFLPGNEYAIQYPIAASQSEWTMGIIGIVGLLVILCVACVGAWRRGPWRLWSLAAWCWLLFLLPVSQLFFQLQNHIADRYMLLPSLAGTLVLAALCQHLIRKQWLQWSAIIGLAFVYASLSLSQTQAWSSSQALYRQALQVDPGNMKALAQLVQLERKAGRHKRAWHWLQRGLKQEPYHPKIALQHALLLLQTRQTKRAIKVLEASVTRRMDDIVSANLALLYLRSKQPEKAFTWAKKAASYRPKVAHNQRVLGVVALQTRRLSIALKALQEALRLQPNHPQNHMNLAAVYQQLGRIDDAQRHAAQARQLQQTKRRP